MLVHVHAWEYVNGGDAGGGFDWYAVEAAARSAYETALKETAESNWANFFVSGVTV